MLFIRSFFPETGNYIHGSFPPLPHYPHNNPMKYNTPKADSHVEHRVAIPSLGIPPTIDQLANEVTRSTIEAKATVVAMPPPACTGSVIIK